MWVRDCLDGLWRDEDFADWYPRDGRPGLSPAQLTTVCVRQFLLDLSDRQATEAVRCRIDFKYALAIELDDPGFHHSVLADFRERLTQEELLSRRGGSPAPAHRGRLRAAALLLGDRLAVRHHGALRPPRHIMRRKGFAAHLTETCPADRVNVITDVATTSAAANDAQALPGIHTRLARR